MNNRVWVLGDAVVDLIPEEDGRLLKCPGGAPANVAVGISRLGGNSAFIGRVGNDPFGTFLRKTLNDEAVNTEFMLLDPHHRTSTVVVENDAQGERSFTFMVLPSADLFCNTLTYQHLNQANSCICAPYRCLLNPHALRLFLPLNG